MKIISSFSKNLAFGFSKSNQPFFQARYCLKDFSEKIKFNFEDPLNFTSLLTEEEQMVKKQYKSIK
jgi:hypothetical protein